MEEGNGDASCMGPLAVELSQGHQAGDTGWGWREGYAPAGVVKPLCSERKCKQVRYTSCAYLHFLIIPEQTVRRLNDGASATQPQPRKTLQSAIEGEGYIEGLDGGKRGEKCCNDIII